MIQENRHPILLSRIPKNELMGEDNECSSSFAKSLFDCRSPSYYRDALCWSSSRPGTPAGELVLVGRCWKMLEVQKTHPGAGQFRPPPAPPAPAPLGPGAAPVAGPSPYASATSSNSPVPSLSGS